jgi:hypothetical protein
MSSRQRGRGLGAWRRERVMVWLAMYDWNQLRGFMTGIPLTRIIHGLAG